MMLFEKWSAWSGTTVALVVLGIWAFFEASVWFIIPDALLLLLVIGTPKRWKRWWVVTALSSLVGVTLFFFVAKTNPVFWERMVLGVPFVSEKMFAASGSPFLQSLSGVPVKVWAVAAARDGVSFFSFFGPILVSRVVRMGVVTGIAYLIGTYARGFVQKQFSWLLPLYIAVFFFVLTLIS